jgi:hypothetical protein
MFFSLISRKRVEAARKKLAAEAERAAAGEQLAPERRTRLRGHQSADSDKDEQGLSGLFNGHAGGRRNGSTGSHRSRDVSMVCSAYLLDALVIEVSMTEWRSG